MADSASDFASDFGVPEDFVAAVDGEVATGAEGNRLSNVAELVSKGNDALREGLIDEALRCYSKAHLLKPGDPTVLSNRSVTFCRISRSLRNRSATESDKQPLYGPDPTIHAELALKDAEKVLTLRSNSAKSYFLKADALILLERCDEAYETLLLGLQEDPFSYPLQNMLQKLKGMSDGSIKRAKLGNLKRCDEFDCTLCFKLLYEPVTTPCGHSFCRTCLFQTMDHGNKCPMCRTVLFISPRTYPVSVTLKNIIQKNFSEEYAERKAENESLTNLDCDVLPLFVLDVVLPCQKLPLNIFEPRYRLMVRRVMEGNHRMGMVVNDSATGSIADIGCEVEISECEPFPDGRFYLEVEGRRRFQILRSWDQDGYHIAEVEWIQDILPLEGTTEREDLQNIANRAAEFAQTWIRQEHVLPIIGRRSRQTMSLRSEGMPNTQDPERFSFWFVNLLNLGPSQRLDLLRLRDTHERISRGLSHRTEHQGCRVQ